MKASSLGRAATRSMSLFFGHSQVIRTVYTRGVHSVEAPKVEPPATSLTPNRYLTMTEPAELSGAIPVAQPVPAKKVEEEDGLEATALKGTPCQRAGCKVTFTSDEENRMNQV
jgi:hypothetical protein